MKRLTYTKNNSLNQLCDELITALPALTTTNAGGLRESLFRLSGTATTVIVEVPDSIVDASVATVVTAHVPSAGYGQDTVFDAAVTWLKGTAWPILQTTPPGALSALQQANYNKAMLVVVRRLFAELK